jgi:coenzyme F420-reducing hydrogenase alpha subunit
VSVSRKLTVKSLTRVEGEGALRVKVVDGRIEIAEFNIYEPPRFFERLLRGRAIHEVPDIVARICGICPVAYQLTACHALEKALGIDVTAEIRSLRRLLYCGEWIQSHALHVHLLHAPDFLGYESGFTMAADHPLLLERGLRLKEIGGRIIEVIGGRVVHPVNVTVGGFYKAPSAAAIRGLVGDLEWGLAAAIDLVGEVSRFEFQGFRRDCELVSLVHPLEYPMNEGRVASSKGLDIPVEAFATHFEERQVPHSTALHSVRLPGETSYLTGPVARIELSRERLPERAHRTLDAAWGGRSFDDPSTSIVARAVEIVAAFEEAIAIARSAAADVAQPRVEFAPRAGEGCHATEAPRGLLYHRYRIGGDGLVAEATIIPPTSQNQAQIERDLVKMLPDVLALDDAAATLACERLIRSYDPCISCATHFLRFSRS